MIAQRCARDAASFIHPLLADIKHNYRTADGKLIMPVIFAMGLDANANGVEAIETLLAARDLLRPAQIATGRAVPLAGVLGLFHFSVVAGVKPFQPTTRITRLDVGWLAIVLSCDVVGNVRDLSAEGLVEGIIGRPHQRSLGHWSRSSAVLSSRKSDKRHSVTSSG
jgi:hypothetical protein